MAKQSTIISNSVIVDTWNIHFKKLIQMIAIYKIEELNFNNNSMFLNVDGRIFTIPLDKASKKLSVADEIQRELYKISPSGYGIHWPLIDEDLSIDYLIKLAK